MSNAKIEKARLELFDVLGLLAFAHDAVYSGANEPLCLEYDSRDGLATMLRHCRERTQAALDELEEMQD